MRPDNALCRRWTHSFEEDHDGVLVYRPNDYGFPPARGRDGIEFKPDGGFIDWAIGRGDGLEPRPGRWQSDPGNLVRVSPALGIGRVLEVVRLEPDLLEVRDLANRTE